MGNNSLSNTEKNLRSIAKRYENVKYSVGLAVLFLMNGTSAFSDINAIQGLEKQNDVVSDTKAIKSAVKEKKEVKQASQKLKASWVNMQFGANDMYSNFFATPKTKVEKTSVVKNEKTVLVASADNSASLPMFAKLLSDIEETTENRTEVLTTIANKEETPTMEEIKASKQELRSSVGNLQDKIDTARRENQKEIDGLRLELIKLMEQGNQVVKSPWSSWQFGANYFYDDWGSAYKGRGDKAKEKLNLTKKTDPLERFKASSEMSTSYGTTSLDLVYEPPKEVEVSAGIRPKEVNKKAPTFVPPEPSGALPPFEPKIVKTPQRPATPDKPEIVVFNPIDLTFNGTGFGQGSSPSTTQSGLYIENYHEYNTTSPVYLTYTANGRTMTGGTVQVKLDNGTAGTSLVPGTASSQGVYFINDAADHDVKINGDYDITRASKDGEGTLYFVSLNPYSVGATTRTYEFAGNLTLHGHDDPTSGSLLLGFEHQLLTYNHAATVTGTSILKNSGTINLASGYNLVGIQIDTEYSYASGEFIKQPQTINAGTINITSKNSIGIDYGYYDSYAPNTKLYIGNVNVKGENNYGLRMKDYHTQTADYYDKTDVTGENGVITVEGKKNVGIYMAQGASTGDPLAKVTKLQVKVGGENNIGFLRSGSPGVNSNPFNLDSTRLGGTFTFNENKTTKNSALVRSDFGEVILSKDYNWTTGNLGDGNSFLQAGKTGTVTYKSGNKLEVKANKFYAMTAGSFDTASPTTGATINNAGTIKILGGTNNIAMAVDKGNTGSNLVGATIEYTSKGGTGVYNLGTYNQRGTLKINGENNIGIYNKEGTVNISGVTTIDTKKGSKGIYSDGGTITSTAGANLKITTDDTGSTTKGIGVYIEKGANVDLTGANIVVKNGSAGVASYGKNSGGVQSNLNLTNAKIDYTGDGYAIYVSDTGKADISGATVTLRGKAIGFEKTIGGTNYITTTSGTSGTKVNVFSNDATIVNLKAPTSTLNLTNLRTNAIALAGISGVNNVDTSTGTTYTKYKIAAIDGLGAYNIDKDLDKKVAAAGGNSDFDTFTKNLIVQRAKVNLKAGKNAKAILTGSESSKIGESTVVGLAMSSSSSAVSNNETQINMEANTKVTADRTDAGNGAVGLYINYGKINTDASSTINVEKETSNSPNDSAVGIYSVNGSEVTNAGKVNVGGKNSIGILGVAYRIDSKTNNPIINEFGASALGQGKATVLNKGEITLDGANGTGIYIKNNNASATRATAVGTNDTTGIITLSGVSSTGMSGDKATLENKGTINVNGQKSVGMFAKNSSELKNSGTIKLANGLSENKPNIAMYTNDANTKIINDKDIIGGNNTYGIYGKKVDLGVTGKVKVGNSSVGIYSNGQHAAGLLGSTVYLPSGSKIEVGKNQSVGVFTTGTNQIITGDADMKIGDSSYGYVIKGTGTQLDTNVSSGVTLGNDAVYVYSSDRTGHIRNNTELTATGSKNYGIYSAGTVTNLADIKFGTGTGNVGVYSIGGGTATNGTATIHPTITVSGSDTVNKSYGIGMAAGYVNDAGTLISTGNVVNYGTIKVGKDNGIGMFATGSGSTATNRGTIELTGKKTVGMYLDNNAIGYNYGTITTVPNPSNDGIVGVVASNGAIIKNYGTINIVDGSNLTGVFINKGTQAANYDDQIPGGGTGVLNGKIEVKTQSPTGKTVAGIDIKAPGDGTATIYRDGKQVTPIAVDTVTPTPQPLSVNVGTTSLDLSATDLATPSLGQASSIGMYVDTSGVNYTNPIQGLNLLTGLQKVDLIFGTEASKYTNKKDIEVGQNILKPYNDVITSLSGGTSMKFSFTSGSLTWIATATQNTDDTLKALYLSKIPYTAFAKDKNTGNFLAGLEQRYGVEGLGTREKTLFDKLNGIGKGEAALFAQAVDQMKGHQYSNVQQRIQATGNILDKEFDYLRSSWSNPSKDSNKIKTFGARGEYNTDTAGVEDYKNHAYGVAYVHEDETVRLGESTGWYAGIVHNTFKFKDIGNSKEEQLQGKIGIFKSIPFDENNSLNWTISGDIFVGYNKMNRRFLVVDEVFSAKSRYYTYGLGIKNEISKSFRLSESFSFIPHAGLKLEYGRFNKIKEKSGEMRLEVKGNDYLSVKPEIGAELAFKQYFGRKTVRVGVSVAYENELGKVANAHNKARVAYTTADWYNLRGEKEDRRGNVKTDLNIGVDNQRIGVTGNVGYDTKGSNIRGGLGLRVIF